MVDLLMSEKIDFDSCKLQQLGDNYYIIYAFALFIFLTFVAIVYHYHAVKQCASVEDCVNSFPCL